MRQYIVKAIFTTIIELFYYSIIQSNWKTIKDNLYIIIIIYKSVNSLSIYIYMNNFWNNLSDRIKIVYHKIKEKYMNIFLLHKK